MAWNININGQSRNISGQLKILLIKQNKPATVAPTHAGEGWGRGEMGKWLYFLIFKWMPQECFDSFGRFYDALSHSKEPQKFCKSKAEDHNHIVYWKKTLTNQRSSVSLSYAWNGSYFDLRHIPDVHYNDLLSF